jgi:hypothetical protein
MQRRGADRRRVREETFVVAKVSANEEQRIDLSGNSGGALMIHDSLEAKIRRDVGALAMPPYSATAILAIPTRSKKSVIARTRTVLVSILAGLVLAFPLGALATHAASLKDFIRGTLAAVGIHDQPKPVFVTSTPLSLAELRTRAPFAVIVPKYLPKTMHSARL